MHSQLAVERRTALADSAPLDHPLRRAFVSFLDPRRWNFASSEYRDALKGRSDRTAHSGGRVGRPPTPDPCGMQPATLPDRLRWFRKNRGLRGHATPDSCDW